VHQAAIERAFGRILAALFVLLVAVAWSSSATLAGLRPLSVAVDLLLSVLLIGQALRALRRPPPQRDLYVLAAATGALLLASRALVVPGEPLPELRGLCHGHASGRCLGPGRTGSWCRSPSCSSS